MAELPSGTVTFLFTDVEGSTRLLHELGAERYAEALTEHRLVLRRTFAAHGGVEVDTQGDAFFYAFPAAEGALRAAGEGQEALAHGPIRVRMGIHTGRPHVTEEGYVGDDVHLAARIATAAHGGQVVLSRQTQALIAPSDNLLLGDLGEHRLKDIPQAVPIYQLGDGSFPPLKTISNTNLPRPASTFVGRERETAEVVSLLRDGARLVTLSGPGGSGKTRLAIEAAAELVPEYKAGVFWVGLAALRDAPLVTETISQTLGAKDGLAEHVGEREMLLLLDNLEQVVECAPELASLVEACPNLTLLCTSRELLRVRGEVEYAVPPLAQPEAVALFCARSGLEPSEDIGGLCVRLDSLPLAVELAAARTKALTVSQIVERLAQRLDLLKGGRDADPRQLTLRATIEWSYGLLSPAEQQLFARLSVFAGGCTLEAAEEVCHADLDTFQSLVEKSLLRFTNGRYRMLETIREYAAERLGPAEADHLLEWLATHLLAVAVGLGAPMFRGNQAAAFARFEAEYPNTRAAMAWALRSERFDVALELVGHLGDVWISRGHAQEAESWIDASLGQRHSVSARARGRALIVASDVMKAARRPEHVIEVTRELVETMAGSPEVDPLWIAAAMADLSDMARERGDFVQAREWAERSLDFRIANGLPGARALMSLAELALEDGDPDRAEQLYQQAADHQRAIGHQANYASSILGLGEAARRRGAFALAIERMTKALELRLGLGDLAGVGDALQALARVASDQGQPERSGRLWGAGAALLREWHAIPEPGRPEPLVDAAAAEVGSRMTLDEAVEYALAGMD